MNEEEAHAEALEEDRRRLISKINAQEDALRDVPMDYLVAELARRRDTDLSKIDTDVQGMIAAGKTPLDVFNIVRRAAKMYVPKLEAAGKLSHSLEEEGHVPSMHVIGRTLAETWENATMALVAYGVDARTGYDLVDRKTGDFTSFPSLEGTIMMHIKEPFGEPRLHMSFLGGYAGLGDYKAEIEGVKDHWMITPEKVVELMKAGRFAEVEENEKWKYTYHQRLFSYPFIDIEAQPQTIDQFDCLVKKLSREPSSKSAQAITWDPRWDHNGGDIGVKWKHYDSPCLQRLWFRLLPDKNGGYVLNLNTDWRSRDHLKAVPQNIFAVTEIYMEGVRAALQENLKVPVRAGRYVDKSDSLHLYGHYLDYSKGEKGIVSNDVTNTLADMLRTAAGEPFERRVITCKDPDDSDDLFNIAKAEIQREYEWRKANPDVGAT